ncbi:DUF2156 domain-containing protein [Marinobacter sp. R17]|uniref:DUF2156 domain-containing protein n=1 Tax=Marinobacter sp. R17 TaxID=2484250 RepID=UPI000F4C6786|nr:DUF2156 domain-containing protein [Marinobacter sp. R17]ROU02238.1 DUF2156 domain-containing protein [Marinobacter sp. R17]
MTSLPSSSTVLHDAFSPNEDCDGNLTLADCQALLARYGSQSSAYFTLQQDTPRFGARSIGFIAYRVVRIPGFRFNIVFANPVCDPKARSWLLGRFLKQVPGRHLFVGIDAAVSRDLATLGFRINEFGTEFSIDLTEFSLAGKHKKQLRHAANLHKRSPVTVQEQAWDEVDAYQVATISSQWRSTKAVGTRELSLLTRPPVMSEEWGVRKFYGYLDGKLAGYVFFDPYFRDGRVAGYTANILRQDLERAPTGLLDYIILQAMERFREEGVNEVSLGIAPLYNIEAMSHDRPMIRRVAQFLYNRGNRLYAFRALGYHKSRYRAREAKWYIATDSSSVLGIAWSILQGTGVLSLSTQWASDTALRL